MQVFILIVAGVILLLAWVISAIQDKLETTRWDKERLAKIRQKWGKRTIDKRKVLEERNEDIVQGHLRQLQAGYHRSYYIENSVRDCIQEIAEAEHNLSVAPNHEYLSNWEKRATPEYLVLKNSLLKRFRERHQELDRSEKEKRDSEITEQLNRVKEKYSGLISQFYEITERKVSLVDDYGDENWDVLPREIDALIRKIAKKEGYTDDKLKNWKKYDFYIPEAYKRLIDFLNNSFSQYHQKQKTKPSNEIDYSRMSGVEFEAYLVKLLKEKGFSEVRGTPTSGDQGADLIAKKDGKTIIIQAKRYDGPVGNKAVQEVASAVAFYRGDEGWVITNSSFTKSARELAQRTGIKLIDGRDLSIFF